ncbi:MAG: GNAT family N-acetyltransferase [Lewinellaceae bacterium]|nr:GNAT family N-acetyltransferase [Lewinellaceae bacterium]
MLSVSHTEKNDLAQIFTLFEHSIEYQEKKGYPVWRNYDKQVLIRDMEQKNQYKAVIDGNMAIVWSVCYTDKVIWREREKGDAIYLHRIVVNPDCKGQRLFGTILDWAIQHAGQNNLRFIRMDTWADNPTIINYYLGFGFAFVEYYTTPDDEELPAHNRNLAIALLEYK